MHIIALKSAVIYGSWRDSRFYKIESFLHPVYSIYQQTVRDMQPI